MVLLNNYSDSESDTDVFIEPPDVRVLTDEDSGDKNGSLNLNLTNISGNQLRATASILDKNKENICDVESYPPWFR